MLPKFRRPLFDEILRRSREPRRFIQVLAGPRQAGKTTLARQVLEAVERPHHYASADDPSLRDPTWIETQWERGRLMARESGRRGAVLALDEVQKVVSWSDVIKRLWDEDTLDGTALKVLVLGSSPLLVARGLTESLAGRFELVRVPHWSFDEMRDAFGWNVEKFIYFGGYPGSAPLIRDRTRWARYILDSLLETTISRDVLLLTRVDKPALLRQLFRLICDYSGKVLSYQKMLGQLQEAGNTTTLAHYLDLLSAAGIATGLQKYSGSRVRQRGSSPKLVALNTALVTASFPMTMQEAKRDPDYWGRLAETAVGAHLVNSGETDGVQVFYWRERSREVDFVLRASGSTAAIEVTSGRRKDSLLGMEAFDKQFRPKRKLLVGAQGIPLDEFLTRPAKAWVT